MEHISFPMITFKKKVSGELRALREAYGTKSSARHNVSIHQSRISGVKRKKVRNKEARRNYGAKKRADARGADFRTTSRAVVNYL